MGWPAVSMDCRVCCDVRQGRATQSRPVEWANVDLPHLCEQEVEHFSNRRVRHKDFPEVANALVGLDESFCIAIDYKGHSFLSW